MTYSMHVVERIRYVYARSMSVGMNTSSTNNEVVRFKSFGGAQNCRTKSYNVATGMKEYVKFWFIEPLGVPQCRGGKEVSDRIIKSFLWVILAFRSESVIKTHQI
jgi:hypothetical protein